MPAIVQVHYVHIRSRAAVATGGTSNVDVSRVCHQSAFFARLSSFLRSLQPM